MRVSRSAHTRTPAPAPAPAGADRPPLCRELERLRQAPTSLQGLVVYTHADLISEQARRRIEADVASRTGVHPLFLDLSDVYAPKPKFERIRRTVVEFVLGVAGRDGERRQYRIDERVEAYVVGFPNVGKSTFNLIVSKTVTASRKAPGREFRHSQVDNSPGWTTVMRPYPLNTQPELFLIDTPVSASFGTFAASVVPRPSPSCRLQGLIPKRAAFVAQPDLFYKLAAVGCYRDDFLGPECEDILDFLLFKWNAAGSIGYIKFLGLPGPTDDVTDLIATKPDGTIATHAKRRQEAMDILQAWRDGRFGRIVLDDECPSAPAPDVDQRGPAYPNLRH